MRMLALMCAGLLGVSTVSGQVTLDEPVTDDFGYELTSQTTNDFFISEEPVTITTFSEFADDQAATIRLPFNFKFYDNEYLGETDDEEGTIVTVSTNGYIMFDTAVDGTDYTPSGLPNTGTPNNGIYGFWYDLEMDAESELIHGPVTVNSKPGYMITWESFGYFSETGDTIRFQIILESENYNIYVIRNVFSVLSASTSTTAIIGIENQNGNDGIEAARITNGTASSTNTAYLFNYPGTDEPTIGEGDGEDVEDTSIGGSESGVFTGASPPGLENNEVIESAGGGGCLITSLRKETKDKN